MRERDADRLVLTFEYTQTAARQRAELPGVPKGTKVTITKYLVSGTGSTTLELSEPLPLEGQTHAVGTQVFSVHAQGDQGTLTQKLALDVKISRPSSGSEA